MSAALTFFFRRFSPQQSAEQAPPLTRTRVSFRSSRAVAFRSSNPVPFRSIRRAE